MHGVRVTRPVVIAAAAIAFAAAPLAQSRFRSGVDLVQVWVSVTNADGRPVTGLTRDAFAITENGIPQPITHFSDERVPVSLGLLVDASDSMRGAGIVDARLAADRFLGDLLAAGDEAFVTTFDHGSRVVADWTTPPHLLRGVLDAVTPSGATAIYDAMSASARLFDRRTHVRAALVVVSDGADTASDRTLIDVRRSMRRTDALIYAIAIDAPDARPSTRVNPEALRGITAPSGGYTEVVRSAADLLPATERIAEELNHQYAIAYAIPRAPDGTWRSIRVGVAGGAYAVRARSGYFADPD